MSLSELLKNTRPTVEQRVSALLPPYTLFFSICDGKQRARVVHASAEDWETAWQMGSHQAQLLSQKLGISICWLRVDWVYSTKETTWRDLKRKFRATKRNYFRFGLSLDSECRIAFLEQELNANAMLYGGNQFNHAVLNENNFRIYAQNRYGKHVNLDFDDDHPVYVLSTQGVFCDSSDKPVLLYGAGRHAGRRIIKNLNISDVYHLIDRGSQYLKSQVKESGQFFYGSHPCFDREINTYNSLRHASTTYAMLEAWEVTQEVALKESIELALDFLTQKLIQDTVLNTGENASFLIDGGNEIKLGGNAVCLLALVKYSELTGSQKYLALLERLALGMKFMQDPSCGKFTHVLHYPDLTVKEPFRIIYYDGEAAFGLIRLYGLTKDPRWLNVVEKAFDYYIVANHWKAHDHWLSYCVNELTLYRPEERYYQFGIQNIADYLDFVVERITTFPTLLELMMAAEKMISRIQRENKYTHLLNQVDIEKFYQALEHRAHYLLNGHFWPEYAMFFKNPQKIVGSFFIRHHAFRIRIDDVEHYLSGFVAYKEFLVNHNTYENEDYTYEQESS
ncbi:hypothetical protein [Zobellella sp. DQSA1]|uniref:hypothetical protein n=1 Tax=Zobellella sp. DQSA1 TaxID=3342386 RepID=UPI0035C1CDA3